VIFSRYAGEIALIATAILVEVENVLHDDKMLDMELV
jgi:hypothetical protein